MQISLERYFKSKGQLVPLLIRHTQIRKLRVVSQRLIPSRDFVFLLGSMWIFFFCFAYNPLEWLLKTMYAFLLAAILRSPWTVTSCLISCELLQNLSLINQFLSVLNELTVLKLAYNIVYVISRLLWWK